MGFIQGLILVEKWVCQSRLLWAFVALLCLFSPSARASHTFVSSAHSLIKKTHSEYKLFEAEEGDDEDLLEGVEKRLAAIQELDKSFRKATESLIQGIYKKTPSQQFLQQLRTEIKGAIKKIQGTADIKGSPLNFDPHGVGGVDLREIDPKIASVIQTQIQRGNLQETVDLFEVCAFYVALQEAYLLNLDMKAVLEAEDVAHLEAHDFEMAHAHVEYAVYVLRMFFPFLPSPNFGALLANDKNERLIIAPFLVFKTVGFFTPLYAKGVPENRAGVLFRSLEAIAVSVGSVERYRVRFFGSLEVQGRGEFISNSLFSVPGVRSCLSLSKGWSTLRGTPCHFYQFKKAVQRYLEYYRKIGDAGVMTLTLGFILDYVGGKYGRGEEAIQELKKKIESIQVKSEVNPNVKKDWPRLVTALFRKRGRGADPDQRNLREHLEANELNPAELYKTLRKAFAHVGLGMCWQQPGFRQEAKRKAGMFECLNYRDHRPGLIALEDIANGFGAHIETPLKKNDLGFENTFLKGSLEDKLKHIESRVSTLDASPNSCPVFLKEAPSEEDKKKAPWVLYTEDGYGSEGNKSKVYYRESANGMQKLEHVFQTRVGSALSIQLPKKVNPGHMLAGVSVAAAKQAILPNVVQLKLILNEGELSAKGLRDLGLSEYRVNAVKVAEELYHFPKPEETIAHAKTAFKEMIHRWAIKKKSPLIQLSDADREAVKEAFESLKKDEPKLSEEQLAIRHSQLFTERLEEKFQKNYKRLIREYRRQMQVEMLAAAKAKVKFKKLLDKAKADWKNEKPLAPGPIRSIFGHEVADALKEGNPNRKETPQERRNRLEYAKTIEYLHTNITRDYLNYVKSRDIRKYNRLKKEGLKEADLREAYRLFSEKYGGNHFHQQHMWKDRVTLEQKLVVPHAVYAKTYKGIAKEYLAMLEWIVGRLDYQFPAIARDGLAEKYDGSEASFLRLMKGHLQLCVEQFNKFALLGKDVEEGGVFDTVKEITYGFLRDPREKRVVEEILDFVVPNRPLMGAVLRTFPQLKYAICLEQKNRDIEEDNFDTVLHSVQIAAAALACVPIAAPVAGVIEIVAAGIGLVVHTWRAAVKAKQLEEAKQFAVSASAQMEMEDMFQNATYYAEMEAEIDEAQFHMMLDFVSLVPTGLAALKGTKGLAESAAALNGKGGLKGLWRQALLGQRKSLISIGRFGRYVLRFPDRAVRSLWSKAASKELFAPIRYFLRSSRGFYRRLSPLFRSYSEGWLPLGRRLRAIPVQIFKGTFEYLDCPLALFGQTWGRTLGGKGLRVAWYVGGGYGIYRAFYSDYAEARQVGRMWGVMQKSKKTYKPWMDMVRGGQMTLEHWLALAELDRKLAHAKQMAMKKSMEDVEFQIAHIESLRAKGKNIEKSEVDRLKTYRANLEQVGKEIKLHMAVAAQSGGANETNPEYMVWKKNYDLFERHRDRVSGKVREEE